MGIKNWQEIMTSNHNVLPTEASLITGKTTGWVVGSNGLRELTVNYCELPRNSGSSGKSIISLITAAVKLDSP